MVLEIGNDRLFWYELTVKSYDSNVFQLVYLITINKTRGRHLCMKLSNRLLHRDT